MRRQLQCPMLGVRLVVGSCALLAAGGGTAGAAARAWPRFRGPRREGHSRNPAWRKALACRASVEHRGRFDLLLGLAALGLAAAFGEHAPLSTSALPPSNSRRRPSRQAPSNYTVEPQQSILGRALSMHERGAKSRAERPARPASRCQPGLCARSLPPATTALLVPFGAGRK